jgi:excisionase family DNA binding protein
MLNDRFLTTGDVADYCQVSRSSVFRWIRQGKLHAFTTPGGHYRVHEREFRSFLARYGMPIIQEYFSHAHDDHE